MRRAAAVAVVLAAVASLALANIVLLGYPARRNDPVGALNPRVRVTTVPPVALQGELDDD